MGSNDKRSILIVDDIEINREILKSILSANYTLTEATGGAEALELLFDRRGNPKDNLPTVILLDIMMPDVDGFHVLEKLKSHKSTKHIPVLFITASDSEESESRGLLAGAADYITKPFNHDIVRARVDHHHNLARYSTELQALIASKTAEVSQTYESTLEALATIIEYRHIESGSHIRRTTLLTEALVNVMLETEKFREALAHENISSMIKATALHDIGKVAIPDVVLLKPGKLTPEEFEVIKSHAAIGSQIVDSISKNLPDSDKYLMYAKDICHCHHERWDGKGYPNGLKKDKIPLSARILSVVDVYDALVNPRCYKEPFSHDVSIEILKEGRGTQFDPDIIDLLPKVEKTFKHTEDKHGDVASQVS